MENPSAFPSNRDLSCEQNWEHIGGMTLLDYFAGKALGGYLANADAYKDDAAKWAYDVAEMMLAERAKRLTPATR
ncbi:hypothetical protein [Hymenobacter siberiensis]|uniref:hypothetical protein n=1 Tax=Hymenobacter siberiensis TaxID=2848396 RepID=UPI001C1E0A42|nr:hypothetical protein [Hymenobacter siberiensis]